MTFKDKLISRWEELHYYWRMPMKIEYVYPHKKEMDRIKRILKERYNYIVSY